MLEVNEINVMHGVWVSNLRIVLQEDGGVIWFPA